MADLAPIDVTNLDGYGAPALDWARPRNWLANDAEGPDLPFFLNTIHPDGRPHSAGIGARWLDGDLCFVSGPATRKTRNLLANPACTVTVRLADIDLVMEGTAARVTDPATLADGVRLYHEVGWPAEVAGDAVTAPYSAPSAGPPPWHLYLFTFHTAFGVATAEPSGATRWRFAR
jgi:hypothetical protein